jgi:protease-4
MGKVLTTILAVIGGLVVGLFAILFIIGGLSRLTQAGVPNQTVLEWPLGPLPETAPVDPFAALSNRQTMTLRDYLDALQKAEGDPKVAGLILTLGSAPVPVSQLQEVREALLSFRAKKKFVYAYSESFSGMGNYYLAAACDRIFLIPSGDAAITGIHAESMFLRGTLEKLGITPHFEGRYEFKNAVNQYMERKFTPAHREATEKLAGSLYSQLLDGIATGRNLTPDTVKKLVDGAPYYGKEALERKLVDALAYRDEAYSQAKAKAGKDAKLLYISRYLERAGRPNTKGQVIALIHGSGAITQGRSGNDPVNGETMGSDTIAKAFRQAIDDQEVKAILFRVDSPGGSAIGSDAIGREVIRARKAGKPVIVSMGSVAASGGYWVSMDADKVVATPGTITGSIGVLSGKMILAGFHDKIGVSFDGIKFGENSTIYDSSQDFSPSELERFRSILDFIYQEFTSRVAAGRKLPKEKVLAVAKGRVWSGADAKELGLVDELGGFRTALRLTKQAAKIKDSDEVNLREYPRRKTGVQAILAEIQGERGDSSEDYGPATADARAVSIGEAYGRELLPFLRRLKQAGVLDQRQELLSMPPLRLSY